MRFLDLLEFYLRENLKVRVVTSAVSVRSVGLVVDVGEICFLESVVVGFGIGIVEDVVKVCLSGLNHFLCVRFSPGDGMVMIGVYYYWDLSEAKLQRGPSGTQGGPPHIGWVPIGTVCDPDVLSSLLVECQRFVDDRT